MNNGASTDLPTNLPTNLPTDLTQAADSTDLQQAIELMYFAYRTFTKEPDRLLEKRGLNRSHHRILYFVSRHDEVSVGQLLNILQISKQSLNQPLQQLVSMGMVLQKKSPTDKRVKLLRLSAKGRRLEQLLTLSQLDLLDSVAANISRNDFQAWLATMRELAAR